MTRRSPLVRRLVPAVALLVIGAPALASCGFDYQTNQVNTISMDVGERGGTLDVIGTVLVSAQPGSGTLSATFVNQGSESAAGVESIAGTGEPVVDAPDFEPFEVDPLDRVTTLDEGGITVEGDFAPGDFAPIEFTLSDGSTIELDVPVVPGCRQWEGVDTSAETADPAAEPVAEDDTAGTAYDCEFPEPFHH